MKKRRIFIGIWVALLAVMSIGISVYFDSVASDRGTVTVKESIQEKIGDDLVLYAASLQREIDPNHPYPKFRGAQANTDQKENLMQFYSQRTELMYNSFSNDKNLQYSIKDLDSDKVILHSAKTKETLERADSSFYATIIIKKDGTVTTSGDLSVLNINQKKMYDYLKTIYFGNEQIYDLQMEYTKNVEITLRIPEALVNNNRTVFTTIYEFDVGVTKFIVSILAFMAILASFLFVYPIQIVEECHPFKDFRMIKLEPNVILSGLLIIFGTIGVYYLAGNTMSGYLHFLLNENNVWDGWILIGNTAAWFLLLGYASLVFYLLKHIFAHGVWRYLKQETWTGMVCRKLRNTIRALASVRLDAADRNLIMLLFINMIVVIILCCMWVFGILFAVVYTGILIIWLKRKLTAIQRQYQELLDSASALEQGNFQYESVFDNTGMFGTLQEKLLHVRDGFEKAVHEETKSQMMKTELISNVSHDLKTPLTGLRNYVELLQNEELPEATRVHYIDMLNQYSQRLEQLIEDLFEVSKVNSGNIQLNQIELDLVALIEQAQAECSEQLEAKQLVVMFHSDEEKQLLMLDGEKTVRIFENLFLNIAKYTLEHTRVYVDITSDADNVQVVMKNISQDPLNFREEEIVERFQRGDSSRHGEGSGLGLAIVKSFAEVQQGSFHIEVDGDLFKAILNFPKKTNM